MITNLSARRYLSRIALFAFSSLLSIVLLETTVRSVWHSLAPKYGFFEVFDRGAMSPIDLWVPDSRVGWLHRGPGRFVYRQPEFETDFVTNRAGFRASREFDEPASGSIALLGDSITEALQVIEDRTFGSRLESILNSSTNERIEVRNFGMSSFGLIHYLQMYRNIARLSRPETVVVNIFSFNDISDSSPRMKEIPELRPRLERNSEGRLLAVLPFSVPLSASRGTAEASTKYWLRKHSASYRLALTIKYRRQLAVQSPGTGGFDRNYLVYETPPSPEFEEAWQISLWALARLAEDVQADGAHLIVSLIPEESAVVDSAWDEVARKYNLLPGAHGVLKRNAVREVLTKACENLRIPLVDLTPTFEEAYRHGIRVHFERDGHLNAAGHELVAKALAPEVARTFRNRASPSSR